MDQEEAHRERIESRETHPYMTILNRTDAWYNDLRQDEDTRDSVFKNGSYMSRRISHDAYTRSIKLKKQSEDK